MRTKQIRIFLLCQHHFCLHLSIIENLPRIHDQFLVVLNRRYIEPML